MEDLATLTSAVRSVRIKMRARAAHPLGPQALGELDALLVDCQIEQLVARVRSMLGAMRLDEALISPELNPLLLPVLKQIKALRAQTRDETHVLEPFTGLAEAPASKPFALDALSKALDARESAPRRHAVREREPPPPPPVALSQAALEEHKRRRKDGYSIPEPDPDPSVFAFRLPPGKPLREQGWKLHVTATEASARGVEDATLPLLNTLRVHHKIVASREQYRRLMVPNRTQNGKYVTIYPDSDEHAKEVAALLDPLLVAARARGLDGPLPEGEKPVGTSGLLSSRWGSFQDDRVWAPLGCELRHTALYTGPHAAFVGGSITSADGVWALQMAGGVRYDIRVAGDGTAQVALPDAKGHGRHHPHWIKDIWPR